MTESKFDPKKEMQRCKGIIRTSLTKWLEIREHGSSDPFYPDGGSLNLLRGHIIYARAIIDGLCQSYGMDRPTEMDIPLPPYADQNLFVFPESDRAKRITSFPNWRLRNAMKPAPADAVMAFQVDWGDKSEAAV